MRRVARILAVDFGLPLPARISARIYAGPTTFAHGLITHAAVPAPQAAELARFAAGVAVPGTLLLVGPAAFGGPDADWPRLIAHEMTHLAQIELAQTHVGPAEWLMEGMAEWVAYRALERLGQGEFATQRTLARAAAAEYVLQSGGLDLDALATPRGFIAQHRRIGTLLTYRLVLHLADDLITRHGFETLLSYFRAFRESANAHEIFAATFRTSQRGLAGAIVARLTAAPPPL